MTIWAHLFPPFDAWWPNIIASVVWGAPALLAHHVTMRRFHRRRAGELHDHLDRVLAALAGPDPEEAP